MRKIVSIALLLALLLACMPAAGAETGYKDYSTSDLSVSRGNDHLVIKSSGSYYLADREGNRLSDPYYSISYNSSYNVYTVKAGSGVEQKGVIDSKGNVLVPAEYGDVSIVSSRWQIGMKFKESTEESSDYTVTNYSTNTKTYYLIGDVHVYYRGQLVGKLSRAEYKYAYAHGDYLCVQNRDGKYSYYNKDFVLSPYEITYSSEYDSVYKKGAYTYYHQGSGQAAFDPSCTLTAAEVDQSVRVVDNTIIDLQGNVVGKLKQNYDYTGTPSSNGYISVKIYKKYGVIDLQGNEVIAPEYDEVSYYFADSIQYGFVGVKKDGLFGFVNTEGRITCDFVYGSSAVSDYGTFAYLKDLSGKYIVLSGLAGELPERFSSVSISQSAAAFVAKNSDGDYGVIGLNGEMLVPYGDYSSLYVNNAGTVAVAYLGSSTYRVWNFDEDAATRMSSAAPAGSAPEQPALGTTKVIVTLISGPNDPWTCSNGHADNTGSFCSVCGEARPTDVTCPGCGAVYPIGGVPNFCPDCGQKLK